MQQTSFDEIVDFAIGKEVEAEAFYKEIVDLVDQDNMRTMFRELAAEEKKHQDILKNVSKDNVERYKIQAVPDLKISDYLVDVEPKPDMNYQDALIIAMKREERSVSLYSDMADKSDNTELEKLFKVLAQEEAKHKLRLETEYEAQILSED